MSERITAQAVISEMLLRMSNVTDVLVVWREKDGHCQASWSCNRLIGLGMLSQASHSMCESEDDE